MSKRTYSVIIERDAEGWYVGSVPELHGCHTQAASLDELMRRVREVIGLGAEVQQEEEDAVEFVGVQRVTVE